MITYLKRILKIVVMLLLLSTVVGAQQYYKLNLESQFLGALWLKLDSSGRYIMSTDFGARNGVVEAEVFSYGKYRFNGSKLTLIDDFLAYHMEFTKRDNYLLAKTCFPFLKRKKFRFAGSNLDSLMWAMAIRTNADSREDSLRSRNLLIPQRVRLCKPGRDTVIVSFKEGLYGVSGNTLDLNRYWYRYWFKFANGKYEAYFDKYKLSSGTYELTPKGLALKDKRLGGEFLLGFESDSVLYAKKYISNYSVDCYFHYIKSGKEANKKFTNPTLL